MNSSNIKLCGLCFTVLCNNNHKIITKNTRDMLDILLIKLNLDIAEDLLICNDCDVNLKTCYDFKNKCIRTENQSLRFTKPNEHCKLNIYSEEKSNNKQDICGICMKVTEEDLYNLSEAKDNIFLIDLIQTHVPEMNLKIIEGPTVCRTCLEALKNFYNFVTNCLYIEKDLGTSNAEQIDVMRQDNKIWIKKLEEASVVKPEMVEIKREENMAANTSDIGVNPVIMDQNHVSFSDTQLTKAKYKCKRCNFSTEHKNQLLTHILTHSKLSEASLSKKLQVCQENRFKLRMFKCFNCTFESQYKRSLVRHMVQHKAHWRCWPNFNNVT